MSLPPRPAPSLPDVARDCRITAAAAAAASAGPPPVFTGAAAIFKCGPGSLRRGRGSSRLPVPVRERARTWTRSPWGPNRTSASAASGPALPNSARRGCRIRAGERQPALPAHGPQARHQAHPPPAARHGPRDQERTRDGTASLLRAARPVTTPPEGRPGQRRRERSSRTRRPGPAGTARPPAGGRSRRSCSVAAAAAIATLETNLLH